MSSWIYDETFDPLEHDSFVYLITNEATGQKYVGKKSFWVRKAGKIARESDWKNYWGSSKEWKEIVKNTGEEHFRREIIHFCVSPGHASYLEAKELFARDVLVACQPDGSPQYFNGNILMSFNHKVVRGYYDELRRQKYLTDIKKQKKTAGLEENKDD